MSEHLNGEDDPALEADDEVGIIIDSDGTPRPDRPSTKINTDHLALTLKKHRADAERQRLRADAAERRAQAAETRAGNEIEQRFAAEVSNVERLLVTNKEALAAADAAADAAEEAGDHRARREHERKAARLDAEIAAAEQRLAWLGANKEQIIAQGRAQEAPQRGGVDLSGFTAKQRRWVEDHPEYLDNPDFRTKIAAAHNYAVGVLGHEVDSPEYYKVINGASGGRSQRGADLDADGQGVDDFDPVDQDYEDPEPRRQTPPRSAQMPVSRAGSARPGAPQRQELGRLSASEREAADVMFSDVPQADYQDANGVTHPGRYKLYQQSAAQMRQRGRLN